MDFITGTENYLNSGKLPYYYLITFISALYIIYKFKFRIEVVFIVLLFWEGFFVYLSRFSPFISYIYKTGYALFAIVLFGYSSFFKQKDSNYFLNIVFIIIGIIFALSIIINNSNIITSLSQFIKKYGIPFLFYYGIQRYFDSEKKMDFIARLFLWIFGAQVIFTIIKLLMFGFGESLVGSISFIGGGAANILPVLGFYLVWINRRGKLTRNDWFIIASFLIFTIASNKRSIWFILPLIISLTLMYVQKSINLISVLKYIPLVSLLFVFGVKSNPSLNKEGSRWGSFDIKYVLDYASGYMFGNPEKSNVSDISSGRAGAFYGILYQSKEDILSKDYLLGYGIESVFGTSYETFDSEGFGVASKGSVGAALQNFLSLGIFGAIFICLFGIAFTKKIENKNLRIILVGFLLWDYIMFYNSTITINANGILFVFLTQYFSSVKLEKRNENEQNFNY